MSKTRILKWNELGMGECKSACADVSQMCHFHRKQAWGSLYCRCLVYSWILRSLTVRCHMPGIYSTWSANYFVGVLKYFCISYHFIEKIFVIVINNEWYNSFLIGCVHNRCSSFLLPNLACITTQFLIQHKAFVHCWFKSENCIIPGYVLCSLFCSCVFFPLSHLKTEAELDEGELGKWTIV